MLYLSKKDRQLALQSSGERSRLELQFNLTKAKPIVPPPTSHPLHTDFQNSSVLLCTKHFLLSQVMPQMFSFKLNQSLVWVLSPGPVFCGQRSRIGLLLYLSHRLQYIQKEPLGGSFFRRQLRLLQSLEFPQCLPDSNSYHVIIDNVQ